MSANQIYIDFAAFAEHYGCAVYLARERNAENAENNVSLASDERETPKTGYRLWFFFENCQKQRFACKRQAENAENRSSLVSETQNLQKNARRRPTKHGKR